MARDREKTLARIHRVRTLQLGLVRADEVRALNAHAGEAALSKRISQLAHDIAPAEDQNQGFSLGAAAYYRDRLQQSAAAAEARLRAAEQHVDRAAEATRAAKRDQSAVEKLMARADAEAVVKAIRALEEAPPSRKIRHDPC